MAFKFSDQKITYQKGPYWALMVMILPVSLPVSWIGTFQLTELFTTPESAMDHPPLAVRLVVFAVIALLIWLYGMLLRRVIYTWDFEKKRIAIKERDFFFNNTEKHVDFSQLNCLEATKYGDPDKEGPFYKLNIRLNDDRQIMMHHRLAYVSPGEIKDADQFFAALPCKLVVNERHDLTRINRHLESKRSSLRTD